MKYGKIIETYNDIISKNNSIIKELGITQNNIIQYKLFKKIIKKCIIHENKYLDDNCCICIEELKNNYITLKCNHSYHIECIIQLLHFTNNCSLCRKQIPEHLPIYTNEKLIIEFISILILNIKKINQTHNYLKKIFNNKIKNINCLNIYNIYKIKKMQKCIDEYGKINRIGVQKILKKFKKKINVDLNFILDSCKLLV